MQARCARSDPELFFSDLSGQAAHNDTEQARLICAGCPVRAECLSWAVHTGQAYGVWGGATPAERRSMRRESMSHA